MVIKNISNLWRFFYDFVALIEVLNSSYNFGLLSAIQDVIYSFPCISFSCSFCGVRKNPDSISFYLDVHLAANFVSIIFVFVFVTGHMQFVFNHYGCF